MRGGRGPKLPPNTRMTFDDLSDRILDLALDLMGTTQPVTYRPAAGGVHSIRGIFNEPSQRVGVGGEVDHSDVKPTIGIRLADLPVKPTRNDEVWIGPRKFKVIDAKKDSGGGAILSLHEK